MLWYKLRQIPNIVVDSVVFSLSEAIAKELRKICILLQLPLLGAKVPAVKRRTSCVYADLLALINAKSALKAAKKHRR